jgi:copper(I)-binding protein
MERLPTGAVRVRRAWPPAIFRSTEELIGVIALILAFTAILAHAALAHEFKVGSLTLEHPWARATPPGAAVGAGYLVITNGGSQPDRLVAATAEPAGHVEIHEMKVKDGVMTMAPLPGGLEIPAGGMIALKPGAFHLMLMDLKHPLKQGGEFQATLTFEKAGTVEVRFAIESLSASGPEESGDAH